MTRDQIYDGDMSMGQISSVHNYSDNSCMVPSELSAAYVMESSIPKMFDADLNQS